MPIYDLNRSPQREAHYQVARAIRLGNLPHPSNFPCADCGGAAKEYDHRDYSKPLDVAPVCRGRNARRGPALSKQKAEA
jgi:hypothetical protein